MTISSDQSRKKTVGYVMAGAGLLMILANALDYLLGWDAEFMPLMIVGLALVITGINFSRKR